MDGLSNRGTFSIQLLGVWLAKSGNSNMCVQFAARAIVILEVDTMHGHTLMDA